MAKETIPFSAFLESAGEGNKDFITKLHDFLTSKNCTADIKESKSGYVTSYIHAESKHTVANYVFRKKGVLLRVYADNIASYAAILDNWPEGMKESVRSASPCKRLIDPETCNPRCQTGFDFPLAGERMQKCRSMCFMFYLNDETKPKMRELLEKEMELRG